MSDMRKFMQIVNEEKATVSKAINESVLMEGPFSDAVKATAEKVAARYNNVKYDLLAKATSKAMDIFSHKSDNPQVTKALQKIASVGKVAVQNRMLLTVLVGMVGALVGLASNPAAASQAAVNIERTIDGDIDAIIQKLQQSGIDVGDAPEKAVANDAGNPGVSVLAGLPHDIADAAKKAAKALHAIEKFTWENGQSISSSRETLNSVQVIGDVQVGVEKLVSHVKITTPDGKLVLGEMEMEQTVLNGKIVAQSETVRGVRFQLLEYFNGLNIKQMNAVQNYIDAATGTIPMRQFESVGGTFKRMANMFKEKAPEFGQMVNETLQGKPPGRYKVEIIRSAVSVRAG